MSQFVAPSYSASVSPELVELLTGTALPEPQREPDQPSDVENRLNDIAEAGTATDHVWRSATLRRDGMQPLSVEAMLLSEFESAADVKCMGCTYAVMQHVKFFVTSASEIVMQVVLSPPDESPALPMYRAWRIASREECAARLESVDAAQCFTVSMRPAQAFSARPNLPFTLSNCSNQLN